jgi:hypothetical protein
VVNQPTPTIASPPNGQLWYNSDTGEFNIYVASAASWLFLGGTGSPGPTGPVMTGPTISASWGGTSYSLAPNSWTKIKFNAVDADPTHSYDSTNNNWIPCTTNNQGPPSGSYDATWLGYYQVQARVQTQTAVNNLMLAVYKNNSLYKYGLALTGNNNTLSMIVPITVTTDIISIYAYNGGAASVNVMSGSANTWITGARVRGA